MRRRACPCSAGRWIRWHPAMCGPSVNNAGEAFLAFFWPGYGDQFLAYNIPGRPVFDLLSAVFFIIGLIVSLWRWRQPAYAFLLLWFATGIIPSLVTGSTANTTRNLAALPAVYLLPAVGFVFLARALAKRFQPFTAHRTHSRGCLLAAFCRLCQCRRLFRSLGRNSRSARGVPAYACRGTGISARSRIVKESPVVISTVYPGPAHDASIALILAGQQASSYRWIDARNALLLPAAEEAYAIIPSSTPPHQAFSEYLRPLDTVTLRPDDLDPHFSYYALEDDPGRSGKGAEPLAEFRIGRTAGRRLLDHAPGSTRWGCGIVDPVAGDRSTKYWLTPPTSISAGYRLFYPLA